MKDMKEALGNNRKPDITHVRKAFLVYIARACEWGSFRYERSNYLRAAGDTKADFLRLRAYLRAMVGHAMDVLDAMEAHQATDPTLVDVEGMRRAAYAEDTDKDPKTGVASGLPHLCGALASGMMAVTQATRYGLLPEDPGQPWVSFMNTLAVKLDAPLMTMGLEAVYKEKPLPASVTERYKVVTQEDVLPGEPRTWMTHEGHAKTKCAELNAGNCPAESFPSFHQWGWKGSTKAWAIVDRGNV